jgi:hypothetical protein
VVRLGALFFAASIAAIFALPNFSLGIQPMKYAS